jgi:drug/metabolite transporter (DMT)-like permease
MTAESAAAARPAGRFGAVYPYLLLALCMLFWSGNWILGRALRDDMPPVALTFWRWLVAGLILAPIALPRLRGKGALLRRSWLLLLGMAITGGALNQVAAYFALRHTETVNAVLLNAASPLFILLASWFFDGERTSTRQILGMLISIGGVLVIMNRGDLSRLLELRFSIGDLALLAVMPLWAFYTIMLRRRPQEIDNIELIFLLGVFGLAALAPAYALESLYIPSAPVSWSIVGATLYMGSFASVGAYLCWNKGAELVGSNRAGFTTYLMPAFATILAVFLLDEQVHLFHLVGITTIILGIWLATSARRASAADRAEPA